jgi:hypothetical protein
LKAIESDRGVPKSKTIDVNAMSMSITALFLVVFLADVLVVEDSYSGPHLQDGVVTLEFVEQLKEHFKGQKVLHKKYAMQILLQAKNLFAYESC